MKQPSTYLTVVLGTSNYGIFAAWLMSLAMFFGVNLPSKGFGNAIWFSDGSVNVHICTDQPLTKPVWFALFDPLLPQKLVGDFEIMTSGDDGAWGLEIPLPFLLTITVALSLLYGWGRSPLWAWFAFISVLGVELGFYVS